MGMGRCVIPLKYFSFLTLLSNKEYSIDKKDGWRISGQSCIMDHWIETERHRLVFDFPV